MYISQLSTTIKNTKDRKMLNYLKKDKKEVEKELKSRKTNEGNIGITTKKGKSIELTHKTSGKEIVVQNTPSVLKKYKKLGYLISMPESLPNKLETMKLSDVWKDYVKKYGKEKAAEKLMDILTMGAWASWDGDRIKRFKKELIKKFSKVMKEGKLTEAVYQLPKGFKGSDVDELDAELYRAGLRGAKPDFNKGTITWHDKPGRVGGLSRIKKILKKT